MSNKFDQVDNSYAITNQRKMFKLIYNQIGMHFQTWIWQFHVANRPLDVEKNLG